MSMLATAVSREHVLIAVSLRIIIWIRIWENKWLHISIAYPFIYSKYISDMLSWSGRSHPISEYWPKICSSQCQTKIKRMQTSTRRCFKNYGITRFGLMCREKSHMAYVCSGHHDRAQACQTAVSLWSKIRIGIWEHKLLHLRSVYPWVYLK